MAKTKLRFLFIIVLIAACNSSSESSNATSTPTKVLESGQLNEVDATSTPTKVLDSGQLNENGPTQQQITSGILSEDTLHVPNCVPNQDWEEEAYSGFRYLYQLDSFRYTAIYRFIEEENYAHDELSLQVSGTHMNLVKEGEPYSLNIPSLLYERSHVTAINLQSNSKTEVITNEKNIWVSVSSDPGWAKFNRGEIEEVQNLVEVFGPQVIANWFAGLYGSSLGEVMPDDLQMMKKNEIINGREVIHYCWDEADTYLWHILFDAVAIGTSLEDIEFHVWTSKADSHLVRFAIKAKHSSDVFFELVEHDSSLDFLYWVEINDVGQDFDVEVPSINETIIDFQSIKTTAPPASSAPYNDFPLPNMAAAMDKELYFDASNGRNDPREYEIISGGNSRNFIDSSLRQGLDSFPMQQRHVIETELKMFEITNFYLDELVSRSWVLEDLLLELGVERLFLSFRRDEQKLLVVIEERPDKNTIVWAVVPPDD